MGSATNLPRRKTRHPANKSFTSGNLRRLYVACAAKYPRAAFNQVEVVHTHDTQTDDGFRYFRSGRSAGPEYTADPGCSGHSAAIGVRVLLNL